MYSENRLNSNCYRIREGDNDITMDCEKARGKSSTDKTDSKLWDMSVNIQLLHIQCIEKIFSKE